MGPAGSGAPSPWARAAWPSRRSRLGLFFAVFFDRAFTLFHQLFFAQGSWTFDPATDRLVQLFPEQFWTETSVAIAVVVVGLAIVVWAVARPRARSRGATAGARP